MRQPFIRYNTGTGGYTVFFGDGTTRAAMHLVDAVDLADPYGTGTVQCDAIVERHLAKFCDSPS